MEKYFKKIEEIEVWKRGCSLAVQIYKLTDNDDLNKDWGLRDQIRRAAVSIPSNIAEGYERESNTEFKRFLYISKGSCGELRTQLYIAQAIGKLNKEVSQNLIRECIEISSMLSALIKSISARI